MQNVNLKFKIGEKLAIVGMNGYGKTTFIKLLCRLYDPTEGEILLNGVNIQKYDYDEYMSVFSVVFQDFSLFSFKIREVVASSKNFDESKVRECLTKANFGDRLQEIPEGVHTYLYKGYDQSGIEISGDKTTVYISHRLASCRCYDKIVVFDNGHILQLGSYEELSKSAYYVFLFFQIKPFFIHFDNALVS